MKQEIKDTWLAELRSDKYTQGQRFLHNQTDNSYCCLGVLLEVMGTEKMACTHTSFGNKKITCYKDIQSPQGAVSTPGKHLVNLSVGEIIQLVVMNDIENKSFNEIANWIEPNIHAEN